MIDWFILGGVVVGAVALVWVLDKLGVLPKEGKGA